MIVSELILVSHCVLFAMRFHLRFLTWVFILLMDFHSYSWLSTSCSTGLELLATVHDVSSFLIDW